MTVIDRKSPKDNQWKMLAMYGSLSLNLGLIVLGGYYMGRLLKKQLHWANMDLVGALVGFLAGLFQLFSVAYRTTKK